MSDIIGVIAKVEDDEYPIGKTFKKVTLGDGQGLKVKHGRDNALGNKWGLLQEGIAIKFIMQDFTTSQGEKIPFVYDIETVEGELPPPQEPQVLPEHQEVIAEVTKTIPPKPIIAEAKDRDGLPLSVKIRTFTVSYAKDLATNSLIAPDEILSYAKAFEGYIWNYLTVKDDDVFRRAISHAKFEAH